MHLKALSMRGFKSFAGNTTLEFEEGINAVVGPNGSGKSNVVDAISWVLGEQGAKSLRAGSMSDVIFSGTAGRPALGRAQVTLTIDNSDATLPLDLTDIEISRTVFRNGGSEYQINGESARLSDIQELMAAAHLGKSKHSLITQGHIERVLNATAQERRELIEEAAGISTYRLRAEQTEKKLEAMKANLSRLEDLEAELSTQLEPLGEQAEAARSARELQATLRQLRLKITAAEARAVQTEKDAAKARADELSITLARAHAKTGNLTQTVAKLQEETQKERATLEQLTQQLNRLEKIEANTAKSRAVAQERLKTQQTIDTQELTQRLENSQKDTEKQQEKLQDAEAEAQKLDQKITEHNEKLTAQEQLIEEIEQQIKGAEKARSDHRHTVTQLTQELARTKANLDRAEDEAQRRAEEAQEAHRLVSSLDAQTDTLAVRLEKLKTEAKAHQELEKAAETRREKAAGALSAAQLKLNATALEVERSRATLETLRSALPEVEEGQDGGVQLFENLSISSPWHTALATALARWEETLVSGSSTTRGNWRSLGPELAEKAHRQWVLPATYPDFLTPAVKAIEAEEGIYNALSLALHGTYLHPKLSKEQGRELIIFLEEHPLAQAYDEKGTCRTAYGVLPPTSTAGALELYARTQEAEQHLRTAQATHETQEKRVATAEQELDAARASEKEVARTAGALAAQHASIIAEQTHLLAKAESAQENQNLLADRAEKATHKAEEAKTAYTQAHTKLTHAQNTNQAETPEDHHSTHQKHQKEHHRLREELAKLTTAHLYAQQQVEAAQAHLDQLTNLTQSHQKALTAAQAHNSQQDEVRTRAQNLIEKSDQLTASIHKTITELQESSSNNRQRIDTLQIRISTENKALATSRQLLESITAQKTQLTIQQAALHNQWQTLENKAQEELAETLEDILEKTSEDNTEDLKAAEEQLIDAQKALAAIGAVNPLALEEYRALSERHTYLADQIKDLKKTRADLRAIIKELNERINREFTTAFTETAAHFERIFAQLFPGGEGTLSLTSPGDVLNSGIEIHAKPAGKKVKRISLLSGGERALASLALLTAIFAARPTPFYVLDEVEAALDDRNLGRLLEVFQEIAQNSQLIIITHKTRTIEIADTMHGISMKDGVSLVLKQSVEQLRHLLGQG